MSTQVSRVFEFGPFRLDEAECQLFRAGVPVPIPPKVFDTLMLLIEHRGHLVGKDELMSRLWPDSFVEEVSLNRSISTLRRALGETTTAPLYVETVPKRGYRFIAAVVEVRGGDDLFVERRRSVEIVTEEVEEIVSADSSVDVSSTTEGVQKIVRAPRIFPAPKADTKTPRRVLIAAVVLAAIAVVASFYYLRSNRGERVPANARIKSIAVLPFKPLSGNELDGNYLGNGIADALITRLGTIEQINVRPTSAILRFDNPRQDSLLAARALSVDAVIEGSYQREGARLRVTVQLVSARDGAQIWSGTFDKEFKDILAVQDSISQEVAQTLVLNLNDAERRLLTKRPTANIEAYEAYLKGRYFWNKRTGEGLRQSLEYFNKAIDLDSTYALAYAGLADSYAQLASRGIQKGDSPEKAKAAALKALEIEETLAEAHASLGYIKSWLERDWLGAEAEYKRAIELNPNYATARHWYGEYLGLTGRFDEGFRELELAQRADPLSVIISLDIGKMHYFARQPDRAIDQLRKTLQMDPSFPAAGLFLGMAYHHKGMHEEAIAELRKQVESAGEERTIFKTELGYLYAVVGRKDEAMAILDELKHRIAPAFEIAVVHAGLGQREQALAWLEKAYERRDPFLIYIGVDPNFDGLRSDRRFADLLRRLRLGER